MMQASLAVVVILVSVTNALTPCDDVQLNHCQVSFNSALGIPGHADWHQPQNLENALESIYMTQGTGGFIKVCRAWNNFQACLGNSQFVCLNPRHFLNHGYFNTTFQFVAIIQKMDFMCGSGYAYAVNSWPCLSSVFRNKQPAIQQCYSRFQSLVATVPAAVCSAGNSLTKCVGNLFDEYCGLSSGWFGCEVTRKRTSPQYPGCLWTCQSSYAVSPPPTQTFPALPTTTPVTTTTYPYSSAPGWQKAGAILANSIDFTADPCQDFYQFSCGQWKQNHPIPSHHSSVISFSIMQDNIYNQINAAMQNISSTSGPYQNVRSVQQAKLAWNACINSANSNYNGSHVLALPNEYGGWPMINPSWSGLLPQYSFDFLVGHFQTFYGISSFLPYYVDTDWVYNTRQLLWIDQPSLFYSTIYYTTPAVWKTLRPNLLQLMISTCQYFASVTNTQIDQSQLTQDANDLLDLEYQMAQESVPAAQRRNYTKQYNIYNTNDLAKNYPNINFLQYFKGVSQGALPFTSLLFPNSRIGLNQPGVMTYVNKLWTMAQSDKKVLRKMVNYIMWRAVASQIEFVPALQGALLELRRKVHNVNSLPPTSAQCMSFTLGNLQYPVSRIYVDIYNAQNPGARTKVANMVGKIMDAFTKKMLPQLSWMDHITVILATYKATNMKRNIAYPNWIMNNGLLDKAHPPQELNLVSQDDYLTVYRKLTRFNSWFQLNLLTKPTDRANFNGPPAVVNAWYQPEVNSITFPAGILNSPFFETDFPKAVNYGGMGVVMGHELTHGFDDEGVQWDYNGTLYNWMDSTSYNGFVSNVATCIEKEYGGFCLPNMGLSPNCVNGNRTQGENIADNGGIKAAYYAYKADVEMNGVEARLPPPMNQYSMDQIFFMSFAQVWCRNINPKALQRQLLIDPHSPAQFRVKGTVRNFPAFGQAFNCPIGSPMAPTSHCNIW